MANLTKPQLKIRVSLLIEGLEDLKSKIEDARDDAECERDGIEPYEGHDDLTQAQEERQEWFDDAYSNLDECVSSIECAIDLLGEVAC